MELSQKDSQELKDASYFLSQLATRTHDFIERAGSSKAKYVIENVHAVIKRSQKDIEDLQNGGVGDPPNPKDLPTHDLSEQKAPADPLKVDAGKVPSTSTRSSFK